MEYISHVSGFSAPHGCVEIRGGRHEIARARARISGKKGRRGGETEDGTESESGSESDLLYYRESL